MQSLSGLDGAFLHLETPETPMHVGSLHVFDVPKGHAGDFHGDVRTAMAGNLDLAPMFRRRLGVMPLQFANPVWLDGGDVDLDFHVRRLTLPRPGTQRQLEACAARLHAALMERRRPLWEVHVIEGLRGGKVALYIKVHHAVLDGASGAALSAALFDASPAARPAVAVAHPKRAARPGLLALAGAAIRHDAAQYLKLAQHLPEILRVLSGSLGSTSPDAAPAKGDKDKTPWFGPRTPLNMPITAARDFAGISIPLDEIKAIAAGAGAKVNDVVLALCSGALRGYLSEHGVEPRESLRAAMPISLREAGNTEITTKATMSVVSLCTTIADPVRRLHAIRDGAGAVKAVAQRARSVIPTDFPSIGMPWLIGGLALLYGRSGLAAKIPPPANVLISNVPGPPVALYAAGLRMRTYWPLSIVEHGVGLN
ncbi:MAG: wax ester/triacylglycerol synthase family O-acyltransferase, partial [Betaproteobacteria bacterium]